MLRVLIGLSPRVINIQQFQFQPNPGLFLATKWQ
jgi:hypothetical protein